MSGAPEPLSDREKLLVLAAWFDMWDRPETDRQATLDDARNPGRNDVQVDLRRIAATLDAARDSRPVGEGLREALADLVGAVDDGFDGLAIRIPNPGQRRAIVRAADEARAALATDQPASTEAGA